MRILVTGGNGQLGTCLKIAAENSANEYIFTDADDIDITDPEAVVITAAGAGASPKHRRKRCPSVRCSAGTNPARTRKSIYSSRSRSREG